MNLKQWFAVTLLCVAPLTAQAPRGTVPRSDAAAYAAHNGQSGFQVGASLLSHKELKKVFATDVNQCCLVVEVAFYPAKDNFVKISLDDFMLREAGNDVGTRPSTAEVLAARLEVRPQAPDREHRPGLSGGSEVGYERTTPVNSGSNNGNTTTTRGGVYQRESVGVGIPIGGKSPAPEGSGRGPGQPAGHPSRTERKGPAGSQRLGTRRRLSLFLCPKKSKGGYELVYMAGDNKIVLPLK